MSEPTYEDFKSRISIKTVLEDAGYHFNRRDGVRYPSFVRLDNEGRRIHGDKFIVTGNGLCCFRPPERRNYTVISFIQEHPELFAEYTPGMDKNRLVNLVCNRLLGRVPSGVDHAIKETRPSTTFDLSKYEVQPYDTTDWATRKRFYPFFIQRGLDLNTQAAFADHFFMASYTGREDGKKFSNLAFPFRIPGDERVVGLEERGRQQTDRPTYKGKAEGTNSVEGLWMASIGKVPLDEVRRVLWFEGAFDAMAFHQIQRIEGKETNGLYLSTGGNPGEKQFKGILDACPNAVHHLCFDRDASGQMFACNFAAQKSGMNFSSYSMKDGTVVFVDKTTGYDRHQMAPDTFSYEEFCNRMGLHDPQVVYHPAAKGYKDWNDQLLGKRIEKTEAEPEVSTGFRR